MTSKFDNLGKNWKEKERIINLKGEVSYPSENLGKMEENIDAQQQYSRRNYFFLRVIEETKGKETGNIILEALNNDMMIWILIYRTLLLFVPTESVIRKVKISHDQ